MTTGQDVLRAVFYELDEGDGNAPGHGHEVSGVWDADNGDDAGKHCEWCATWARFRDLATSADTIIKDEPAPCRSRGEFL